MQLTTVPEPLPRLARRAAPVAFWTLVAYGLGYGLVDDKPADRIVPAAVAAALAALVIAAGRIVPAALAVAAAGVGVLCFGEPSNVGWFAACVLIGWAVWTVSYLTAGLVWVGLTAVLVAAAWQHPDTGWLSWIVGCAFSFVGFGAARRQRELALQLRAAQAGLAARAQSEERARIARELHDVIAHSLTVSLLHVSAARLALAEDPADADRSLAEAERLGRSSLDEVRHAVGTLRTTADPTSPLPGSTDVPTLLAGFTAAGLDLDASIEGELAGLPATVGLAAYRIVQEALTNAVKHAAGRPVSLRLAVTADAVLVDVDSAATPGSGHGLGVVGMRERAASVGGRCEAGPGGSGWRVHARLPLRVPA